MPRGVYVRPAVYAEGMEKPRYKYPEYHAWRMAIARCHNPNSQAYDRYGARGITVCDRWRESFKAFLEDMGERPSVRHELDRRDNDGNYTPENCRWVLRWVNDRNRRSSRIVIYKGEERLLIELCEQFGVWMDTARHRLKSGWTVEEAVETPMKKRSSRRGQIVITGKTTAEAA